MGDNITILESMVTAVIDAKYNDRLPTVNELVKEAETIRKNNSSAFSITDEEFESMLKKLRSEILVSIGEAHSLKGVDSTHQSWYSENINDGFYWNRYSKYLINKKHWSPEVVRRLDKVTDEIMDDLGDPTKPNKQFQRRGLLLGDVQSGKTSTYTGICNKAADCGYRIIIILAGMLENLRFQTQERLDAEFAGRESKYSLEPKADKKLKNVSVGVGKIGPFIPEKRISCFTSVSTDFNKRILKSNDLTLKNLKGTALFVVKKNKSVLNNLNRWLLENNADNFNKIDLPLLLIDDEADNASVNTKSEDKDPTAINIAIRNILDSFYQASYLGITATPFANIFIDPQTIEGQPDDLFPRHFITVLPNPSHYIGADSIFGYGDENDWRIRNNAEYSNTLEEIKNNEMENFFKFKHKKELVNNLYELPPSMYEAMNYFIIVNGIRDIRDDKTEHRSMMINVSRYTDVQDKIVEIIENWLIGVKSDVENYALLDSKHALQIKNLKVLKGVWDKHKLAEKANCEWEIFQKNYLEKAVNRIEIRAVNQHGGSSSLNYYAYMDVGLRVIAVGGNSLSRGLTLEGLCVSYFYRNTMMYDTLLQMGRWFGYRNNYEDLFKIWMAEDVIDWYGYVTDATNELKNELRKMEKLHLTPEEFGLKVRQDPNSLIVTARNKMRNGTLVTRPISVSGRLLETPRLINHKDILDNNEKLCKKFIYSIDCDDQILKEKNKNPQASLWRNVPKKLVVNLIRNFVSHPWHLNFQSQALSDYIEVDTELEKWDIAIPFGSWEQPYFIKGNNRDITIMPESHFVTEVDDMIKVSGSHVKVGAGCSTRIGLSEEKIEEIRNSVKKENKDKAPDDKIKIIDSTFLIKERDPILMIHIIKVKPKDKDNPIIKCPEFIYALGVGIPNSGEKERIANYVVNINELKNWIDFDEYEDDDDNI